jgi:imidazolonepropionase-like amidohydrolase
MVLAIALCVSCGPSAPTTAYTGATVWDGSGAPVVENATILVRGGRIVSIQENGAVPRGAEVVSLDGSYVTPGLVNAHGHVSGYWADPAVEDELERVLGDLELLARYGVTTVNSLGDEAPVRAARDAASPADARARVFVSGPVVTDYTVEGARAAAATNADAEVDWLKLRVDDNLGTSEKMPWEAVQAVIDVADERGLRVATHLFYLEDAKRLLEMGSDMVAHSVRDVTLDEEFISLMRSRGVCYVPTLTREVSTFVYGERPDFFDDPFFTRHEPAWEIARVSEPAFMQRQANSPTAAGYRIALAKAMENLKAASDAGLPVAMGTDSGPAARFPGYFEHLELWMMTDAGLTPEQALRSATAVAAECIGADDVGTLEAGKWADFLVFGDDPLVDIRSTRSLQGVYVAGSPVS